MDSKIKAKLVQFLENGQYDLALSFVKQLETVDGNYSDAQRRGSWLYMTMRAEALNDAGLDVRKVMKPTFNIPWTKEMVHDLLWIPIQQTMFKSKTMRALKKLQVTKVHDVIERELSEKFGLDQIPFPNDEERQLDDLAGVRLGQHNNLKNEDYQDEVKTVKF